MTAARKKAMLAIVGPITAWLLTTAAMGIKTAWNNKESVSAHNADIQKIEAQRALDSAFRERLLDAICADRPNIRACTR